MEAQRLARLPRVKSKGLCGRFLLGRFIGSIFLILGGGFFSAVQLQDRGDPNLPDAPLRVRFLAVVLPAAQFAFHLDMCTLGERFGELRELAEDRVLCGPKDLCTRRQGRCCRQIACVLRFALDDKPLKVETTISPPANSAAPTPPQPPPAPVAEATSAAAGSVPSPARPRPSRTSNSIPRRSLNWPAESPAPPLLHHFPAGFCGDPLNHSRHKLVDHFFFQKLAADVHTRRAGRRNP